MMFCSKWSSSRSSKRRALGGMVRLLVWLTLRYYRDVPPTHVGRLFNFARSFPGHSCQASKLRYNRTCTRLRVASGIYCKVVWANTLWGTTNQTDNF